MNNNSNYTNINCYLIYSEQFENIEKDIIKFCETNEYEYEREIESNYNTHIYKLKKSKEPNWKKILLF